jgi:glycerol uptake facilitator-like aquaporin
MPTTTVSATLKWDVLVTNRQGITRDLPPGKEQWTWVPTSATLIFGERDAVPVDAFLTVEQAAALVEWVAASGKNLTTIYVTHGHGDHFFGIGAVLNRFPNARAMATPDVLVTVVAAIFSKKVALMGPAAALGPYLVGVLVWAIGLSLGGTTGCAINPARDLGPRIAHSLLPLGKKAGSGWNYAVVPIVGPLLGAALAGIFVRLVHF